MPIAQDARKKPLSIKVHVSTGEGVEITWTDMHTSRYDFPYLRDHCPCALCNDEREKKAKGGTSSSSVLLPMYKPRVTAKSASAVGNCLGGHYGHAGVHFLSGAPPRSC
jgi:DUF971 family protein